jgi:3-oxoadipate enol-lactonase
MPAINHRMPTRVGTLAIVDEGSGLPVVLWPSLFSDHRLFDHVRPLLGGTWRTIRIDGPGFGQSDPPSGDVQPEQYADAVIDVLNALEVDGCVMAGCSWGGQVSAHVGVRSPDRVLGVLMMNTPLSPSQGGHFAEVNGTRWVGNTRFWGKGVARSMLAKSTHADHPERVEAFVAAFTSFDRKAAAMTARTILTRFAGLGEVLPNLTVPTVILMGAQDALYPPETAMPIARLAPHATIEIVPGSAHLSPIDAPEAVAAAIKRIGRI